MVSSKFGNFGGIYIPETLMTPVIELEKAYFDIKSSSDFKFELNNYYKNYIGRPSPLSFAKNLTKYLGGAKIYLKREDLNHTGSHKINNTIGQALLAIKMGKTRIIAETGAGQHGVASATAAALLGLKCVVYMGQKDIQRQNSNVLKMKILGADIVPVKIGSQTLKDAISEAMRDWVTNIDDTHYLLGSVLGPHPYPTMIRDFQSVIGKELRYQILEKEKRLPDLIIACVGGGSNSIGIFYDFLEDKSVSLLGVEAGGKSLKEGEHASRFQKGKIGVFHGTKTYLLQDDYGQISSTSSISAGLDYVGVGPENAWLKETGRVNYTYIKDDEALEAFKLISKYEGIIVALESAHAIAKAIKEAPKMDKKDVLIVNVSGRGDKDLDLIKKGFN